MIGVYRSLFSGSQIIYTWASRVSASAGDINYNVYNTNTDQIFSGRAVSSSYSVGIDKYI